MKRGTVVGIVFAVLAIIALCSLAGYLTWQYRDQMLPYRDESTESEASALIQALQESATEEDAAGNAQNPGGNTAGQADSGDSSVPASSDRTPSVIWVGDSRTLGMQKAVANSDTYIGAAGEGYKWFVETGLDEMRSAVKSQPESVVVFNLGVNDYDNMSRYMELYESLLEEYPDTHFYFLSVNPIDPEQCHNITNEEIADFNEHLRDLSPDTYLDSYTQIRADEIETIDGIHYSEDGYRFIYDYAVGQIAQIEKARASESGT